MTWVLSLKKFPNLEDSDRAAGSEYIGQLFLKMCISIRIFKKKFEMLRLGQGEFV
jgi:hypothetical protein